LRAWRTELGAALLAAFLLLTAGCATAGPTGSEPSKGTASSGAGAVSTGARSHRRSPPGPVLATAERAEADGVSLRIALCSSATAADPRSAALLLGNVFASRLR
jgi:hypothetical protein